MKKLTLEALLEGLSAPPWRALADGPVSSHSANGIDPTGLVNQARVLAVVLDAGLVVGALGVVVALSLPDGLAVAEPVLFETGQASASGPVVTGVTRGQVVARVGASCTRVDALPVATGLRKVAVSIFVAIILNLIDLEGVAGHVSLANKPWQACADHGPEWQGVLDLTLGVLSTG